MVTAMNPMNAIQNAHAFDLSYPNRPVIANKNDHVFGLSSSRHAEEEDESRSAVAMTKMMVAIRQDSIHLRFAWSSDSWPPRPGPP